MAGGAVKETRDKILDNLLEADTDEVLNIAGNFGDNQEYYCLYAKIFFFKPWWNKKGIEFRPFRNIRWHRKFGNLTMQKIGYYKSWLLEPPFTHQIYKNGKPCTGKTDNTTTFVTFQCGVENRVVSFKEIIKCKYHELIFETPLSCKPDKSRLQNKLAIARHGKTELSYLNSLWVTIFVFAVGCYILWMVKKKRIY